MPAPSAQRPLDLTWLVPLVLVLHGLVVWAVLHQRTNRLDVAPKVMEVSISLNTLPQPADTPPEPTRLNPPPVQPRPQSRPVPTPVYKVAPTPTPTPTPIVMPAAVPATDAPVAPHAEPAPPTPAPAPEPAPIAPPSFSAAYLENPPPAYPSASRRLGEAGRVVLRVRVSAEGRAEVVEVSSSSGFERLDRAALEAVRRWRFVPARQAGVLIEAWVKVPLSFNLDS